MSRPEAARLQATEAPAVLAAKREGWPAVVVLVDNLAEASLVEGVEVWGVRTLGQLHQWLTGSTLRRRRRNPLRTSPMWWARFAVEVAAAGAHHLMMTGPPGVGKTLLAQRLPGLLPPLSEAKSLEVTAICRAGSTVRLSAGGCVFAASVFQAFAAAALVACTLLIV